MSRDSFEQLPGYAALPAETKDLEIAATVRHGVGLFLRRVLEPDAPAPPAGMRLFRERAAQRAEEGMPLHLLLHPRAGARPPRRRGRRRPGRTRRYGSHGPRAPGCGSPP
ncbi:hypothetical protein ACF06X_10750 [Streptomyces sp. NPDC015346]|uniref:hypothetical protein n=1 Tax=Streptomyces sp. NPDC015346 TaxID=3364954 RepID=UPI0036F987D3